MQLRTITSTFDEGNHGNAPSTQKQPRLASAYYFSQILATSLSDVKKESVITAVINLPMVLCFIL